MNSLMMRFLPATMFLEFWKRRQAEIAYEWDLLGYEDEEVKLYFIQQLTWSPHSLRNHTHSSLKICDFHLYSYTCIILVTIIGYMTNSQLTIYPRGLLAQWIEHCTGIVRSWFDSRSSQNFFQVSFSTA